MNKMFSAFFSIFSLVSLVFYTNLASGSDSIGLVNTFPPDGAQDVSVSSEVDIQLNTTLGLPCVSCNPKDIKMRLRKGEKSGPAVPSDVDILDSNDGSLLRLFPRKTLNSNTTYYVIFEHKYKGNKTEFVWVFTTDDGTIGGEGVLDVRPSLLDFGTVDKDSTHTGQAIVTNIGFNGLNVASITPPADPAFVISDDNCTGRLLTPLQSCTLNMAFSPYEEGVVTDVITLKSELSAQSLDLTGKVESEPNFGVTEKSRRMTRLAQGDDARIFVTDHYQGFVYVISPDLELLERWAGMVSPLGITTDDQGRVFVGIKGRKNVQVYDASGRFQFAIDAGNIQMPNDMVIGPNGNLHVVDSLSNLVRVYTPDGDPLFSYGEAGTAGALNFPVAIAVSPVTQYMFVGNQKGFNVKVFGSDGSYLKTIGRRLSAWGKAWQGKFNTVQGVAIDQDGRLHVLDAYLNNVQVFDANSGAFQGAYGEHGLGVGEINVGLDVLILRGGDALVSNSGNYRLERFPMSMLP